MRKAGQDVTVRALTATDLPDVAKLHLAAFAETSLAVMGTATIEQYYEWWLAEPPPMQGVAVFCDNHLAGFCLSGVFCKSASQFFSEQRAFFVRQVLRRPQLVFNVFFNPFMRERLSKMVSERWRRRKAPAPSSATTPKAPSPKPYKILTIAVNESFQGLGLGKKLMAAAESHARQSGFTEMFLDVDTDNDRAIPFYESLGWLRVEKAGSWRGNMRKPLN